MMFTNWEPLVRQWRARNALLSALLSMQEKGATFAGYSQRRTAIHDAIHAAVKPPWSQAALTASPAATQEQSICMFCDGTGWCEGSPAFTCPRCKGSGVEGSSPADKEQK